MGRLRLSSTPWRWATAVVASIGVAGAVDALGAPQGVGVAVAFVVALLGVGNLVFEIVLARRAMVVAGLKEHLAEERGLGALDYLEEPTHGHLSLAAEALAATRSRMVTIGGFPADGLETIVAALQVIEGLEESIRETSAVRALRRDRGRGRAVGGLAAKNSYHADGDPMTLYQDPSNLPDWIHGPHVRKAMRRLGAVLDDVRLLHDAQIEWSVLLFTMWARLVFVASAPLLTGATFGHAPLMGGLEARDIPWLCEVVVATGTALAAPWIARTVMQRDDLGTETRRWLLALEVPVTVAALLATPCWPVASFAAGWTNWWQRPTFSWGKLAAWIVAVSACMAGGMVLAGVAPGRIAGEIAVAMAAIAVIGSSQGAMLPISATLLAQVIVGGLISPRSAQHRADEEISSAIRHLVKAAKVIDAWSPQGDVRAETDAGSLRDIAGVLAARSDTTDRWAGRAPLGLRTLLETALEKAVGARFSSPGALPNTREASHAAGSDTLMTLPPSFYADALGALRLKRRGHARSLSLLVVEIVEEARRYGSGAFETRCHRQDDRIVLRFSNRIRYGAIRHGRGTGQETLRNLAAEMPGCTIDWRGPVDGTFVDLPSAARRFGVEVSLPLDLFEDAVPGPSAL
jgi:hypothetical protein